MAAPQRKKKKGIKVPKNRGKCKKIKNACKPHLSVFKAASKPPGFRSFWKEGAN